MYEKQRDILSVYITDAKLAQCGKYVSQEATTWSTKAVPTKPNKAEANVVGFNKWEQKMQTELIDYDDFVKIYYRNTDDVTCRILVLDKDNNIIQDELSEYNSDGKHIADVVFAPDHLTIIGMRQYTENGFKDFRRIDNKLTLTQTQTNEWLEPEQKAKVSFYNANGDLVFYDIFEKDDDCGMVIMGSFDKNSIQFFWDNSPNEVKLLQSYSDY
ncbi:hypothetical protein [uncultured Moraxella sp.]|uniref:hypothetical protein n=1 Tax=uncultured Moraxella sp. TaxID=263769 RepID=UPI0025D9B858|nr:hypothetical protein [uncultured Moraxella sp.]